MNSRLTALAMICVPVAFFGIYVAWLVVPQVVGVVVPEVVRTVMRTVKG